MVLSLVLDPDDLLKSINFSHLVSTVKYLVLSFIDGVNPNLFDQYTHKPLDHNLAKTIMIDIRIPRILVASISGASLGLAGVYSQLIYRNTLASPSVMGTQAGGILFAVIGFSLGLDNFHSYLTIPLLVICGVLITHYIILLIFNSITENSIAKILILGLGINILLIGVVTLIINLHSDDLTKSLSMIKWLYGSYSLSGWDDVKLIISTFIIALTISIKFIPQLDIYTLGDYTAQSLGVCCKKLMNICLLSVSILISGSIATSGSIPFIGLLAPHLARIFVGASHKPVVIVSSLLGAILAIFCDLIARIVIYPKELEVGILLTIIGGVFFVIMIISYQR